ncbi:MAG: transposase [Acidobacteriaceae bacterium]|nr:transposase [Acidobacteriaceae bacterium]
MTVSCRTCANYCASKSGARRSQSPPFSTAAPCKARRKAGRAGYDGAKRRNGTKVHIAVDTLGHLLALHVTPADEQDRAQVAELAAQVREATDEHVTLAYVEQETVRTGGSAVLFPVGKGLAR